MQELSYSPSPEGHREFFAKHFVKKGAEMARACVETLASLEKMQAKAA